MPILADAEQRDVEERPVGNERVGAVEVLERRLVRCGGLHRRQAFRRDRMDVAVGNGDVRKERIAGHAIIAVRMVVRHEPFVAPEPMGASHGKRDAKAGVASCS